MHLHSEIWYRAILERYLELSPRLLPRLRHSLGYVFAFRRVAHVRWLGSSVKIHWTVFLGNYFTGNPTISLATYTEAGTDSWLRLEVWYGYTSWGKYLKLSPWIAGNELVGDVLATQAETLVGHVCVGLPVALRCVRVHARRGRVRHASGRYKTWQVKWFINW